MKDRINIGYRHSIKRTNEFRTKIQLGGRAVTFKVYCYIKYGFRHGTKFSSTLVKEKERKEFCPWWIIIWGVIIFCLQWIRNRKRYTSSQKLDQSWISLCLKIGKGLTSLDDEREIREGNVHFGKEGNIRLIHPRLDNFSSGFDQLT